MLPLLTVMYIKALKIHFNCAEWIWSITLVIFLLISMWKEDCSVCKLIELISCPPFVIHITIFGITSIGSKSFVAYAQDHIFAAYMQRRNWGYFHILLKCPEFIWSIPKYQTMRALAWKNPRSGNCNNCTVWKLIKIIILLYSAYQPYLWKDPIAWPSYMTKTNKKTISGHD